MLYFQLFQYEIDAKSRDAEDELKIQTQKLQISGQIWYHFVPCNFTKNCHQFFVAIIHFISRKIQIPVRSTELLSSRHLGFACLLSPRVCTPHHFTQPGQHTTPHHTTPHTAQCCIRVQSSATSYTSLYPAAAAIFFLIQAAAPLYSIVARIQLQLYAVQRHLSSVFLSLANIQHFQHTTFYIVQGHI